jgi:hypothetical protein
LGFQAYMDDSRSGDGKGTFVLAGYIATAERWATFENEWRELLPSCPLDSKGRRNFKMSEMAVNEERMEWVEAFFKVIQKHVLASISCRINLKDLEAAKRRIEIPNWDIDWNYIKNPYIFAIRTFYDQFHFYKSSWSQFIPIDEPVDFIFDEDSNKALVLSEWARYIENCSNETRGLYGATPRFEDDKQFLPLQAADLWAWWARKWTDEGVFLERLKNQQPFRCIDLAFSEDQLVETLISLAPQNAPDPIDTKNAIGKS